MFKRNQIEDLFRKHNLEDFKWIDPKEIIVAHWVRMKCTFGCKEYGKNAACPPNTPQINECRSFFQEYKECAVFHFQKKLEEPEQRHEWGKNVNKELLRLEREVFLAGNPKTFLLFMDSCNLCTDCAEQRVRCKQKRLARPAPEAMAVDVFSTVRKLGFPIEVLTDYSKMMNRYAFLLIE